MGPRARPPLDVGLGVVVDSDEVGRLPPPRLLDLGRTGNHAHDPEVLLPPGHRVEPCAVVKAVEDPGKHLFGPVPSPVRKEVEHVVRDSHLQGPVLPGTRPRPRLRVQEIVGEDVRSQ